MVDTYSGSFIAFHALKREYCLILYQHKTVMKANTKPPEHSIILRWCESRHLRTSLQPLVRKAMSRNWFLRFSNYKLRLFSIFFSAFLSTPFHIKRKIFYETCVNLRNYFLWFTLAFLKPTPWHRLSFIRIQNGFIFVEELPNFINPFADISLLLLKFYRAARGSVLLYVQYFKYTA